MSEDVCEDVCEDVSGGWATIRNGTRDEHATFVRQGTSLAASQAAVLDDILARNASSAFGRRHDFAGCRDVDQYRARVPIRDHDAIAAEIDAQSRGESALCAEPVLFYEMTGGSTLGPKLLPYTASSLAALHRAVDPWLHDLLSRRPGIARGRSYWSISPAGPALAPAPDGTPVGSGSDMAFLSAPLQRAFADIVATPPDIAGLACVDEWQYHTLWSLIGCVDLSLISVWSPSFLTVLLDAVAEHRERLLADCRAPLARTTLDPTLRTALVAGVDRRAMADRLMRAHRAHAADGLLDTRILWPHLDTISCWADGPSRGPCGELRRRFPNVFVQPKGLLATEAVVSIPIDGARHPVLAYRSAFFEFIAADGTHRLAHELVPGENHEVIVTTHGGLYRYPLGDTVRCRGLHLGLPTLEFVGRQGCTSDLCGEKLTDRFVADRLAGIDGFAALAPLPPPAVGYCLLLDAALHDQASARALARSVDTALHANPQYAYARRLGQLAALEGQRISRPARAYLAMRSQVGQRLGDIKPLALIPDRSVHRHLTVVPS